MKPVVVYATRFCPYCVGARRFLEEREIPYEEIAVDEQPEKRVEMRQRGGGHTVPQI
jgi:glutaredoxin 3